MSLLYFGHFTLEKLNPLTPTSPCLSTTCGMSEYLASSTTDYVVTLPRVVPFTSFTISSPFSCRYASLATVCLSPDSWERISLKIEFGSKFSTLISSPGLIEMSSDALSGEVTVIEGGERSCCSLFELGVSWLQ